MKLQFTLNFFAAVMHAPRKDVRFALLAQTEEAKETEYRPIVIIKGTEHYAYDITLARFISTDATPEVTRSIEPANVRNTSRGVIFTSESSDAEEFYSKYEFFRTYKTVILNKHLS